MKTQSVIDRAPVWPADGETAIGSLGLAPTGAVRLEQAAPANWRWVTVGVFVVFSALNYLDRQILAAVAPSVIAEFHLSNAAYGTLLAAFSLTYLCVAPLAGLLVDYVGLNWGAALAVGAWSAVTAATGFTSSFRGLVLARMGLGVAEAAGLPCASKANAAYLKPSEFGLGIAVHNSAMTLGIVVAPLLVATIAPRYGWRAAFMICGLGSFLWVPLWWFFARNRQAARVEAPSARLDVRAVIRDRRLWGILAANTLIMTVHSLWMNWTTIYFVRMYHLTQAQANQYFAWIPPIFASLGGLFGASLALRWSNAGRRPLAARMRACLMFAPCLLVTAFVPLMPSPAWAAAAISLSFFLVLTILVNLHSMTIDLFGASHAAFTTALLVSSYALMQMALSPAMGALADGVGFGGLCVAVSVFPLAAALILRATVSVKGAA